MERFAEAHGQVASCLVVFQESFSSSALFAQAICIELQWLKELPESVRSKNTSARADVLRHLWLVAMMATCHAPVHPSLKLREAREITVAAGSHVACAHMLIREGPPDGRKPGDSRSGSPHCPVRPRRRSFEKLHGARIEVVVRGHHGNGALLHQLLAAMVAVRMEELDFMDVVMWMCLG